MFEFLNPLSREGLANLHTYRNNGVDHSITLQYVLGPFYNWVIQFFPLWLAPNLVTTLGFAAMCLFHVLFIIYAPWMDTPAPRWVYFLSGFCLLWYQALDNLDGKQAKRTNSSSPLGEMFDHGVDAITVVIGGLSMMSTFLFGASSMTLYNLFILGWMQFLFATWEEYHTGKLVLWYVNGPIEGILMMALAQFTTAWYGPEVWLEECSIMTVLGFAPENAQLRHFVLLICSIGTFLTIMLNIKAVLNSEAKRYGGFACFMDLVPAFWILFSMYIWSCTSYVYIQHPRAFLWMTGIAFAYYVTNITVGHVAKVSVRWWHEMLILPGVGMMSGLLGVFEDEGPILMILLFLSEAIYITFLIRVSRQVVDELSLQYFTIPHLQQKKDASRDRTSERKRAD